ncbi:MAG TPA: DUF3572 domain-containing protein [Methylocella sp.]|nr:DUF3572 domain-containing protein [Methylocella sp.]
MEKFNFRSSSAKRPQFTKDGAETMAIEALSFLAADPMRLDGFLALSGIGLGDLRAAAAEPFFLAAILDHLAADEPLLLAFAAHAGHDPGDIAKAREILSPPAETP